MVKEYLPGLAMPAHPSPKSVLRPRGLSTSQILAPPLGMQPGAWYSFSGASTSNSCTIHQLSGKGTVGRTTGFIKEQVSVKQLLTRLQVAITFGGMKRAGFPECVIVHR
jgi:hypothetical protein